MKVNYWYEPRVTVVAHSIPTHHLSAFELHAGDGTPLEKIPVFAGRACYQSFGDRAGRKSANDYLGHILDSKHFSVLEHASITMYIEGVSRSLTHEFVRHRHFSYSQLSQRYVEPGEEMNIVVPPAMHGDVELLMSTVFEAYEQYTYIMANAALDLPDKQRREMARAVLPNCMETKIVVTGNLRAWLEFLEKRESPAADAEIRRLCNAIRPQLHKLAPHIVKEN